MEELPVAVAYAEKHIYIECPHCEEINDEGTDTYWEAGDESNCDHCGVAFLLPKMPEL